MCCHQAFILKTWHRDAADCTVDLNAIQWKKMPPCVLVVPGCSEKNVWQESRRVFCSDGSLQPEVA